MTTKIYANYQEFIEREDKNCNGVTQQFLDQHNLTLADAIKENKTNAGCFNCSDCTGCIKCKECTGCSDCTDCSDCSCCTDCTSCTGCIKCTYYCTD